MTRKICLSVCSALLLFLGSCSNDEFQPSQSAETSKDVGFNVISGKQAATRAVTTTTQTIADFRVYGYQSGATATGFITGLDGKDATRAASWGYGTPAQWPDGDVVFNAYSPVAAVVKTPPAAGSLTTLNQLGYVVPAAMADQVDFLVAHATQRWVPGNNKVTMNFKHALSKLLFKVKLVASTNTKINIADISLLNLKMEGTMDISSANGAITWNAVAGSEYKDGSSNKAAWPVGWWTSTTEPEITATATPAYVDVVDDDHAVMILPQTTTLGHSQYGVSSGDIALALTSGNFYIAVTWDMGTVSRTSLCAVSNGASLSAPIAFEAGKQYTFQFDLDAESDLITIGAIDVATMVPGTGDVMDANIGAVVGNVAWAKNYVGAPKTFSLDGVPGLYYQLNSLVGWMPTAPLTGYQQDGTKVLTPFPTTATETGAWTANPCPDGWRIPTKAEFIAMSAVATGAARGQSTDGNGVMWAELTMDAAGNKLRFPYNGYADQAGTIQAGIGAYCWVLEGGPNGNLARLSNAAQPVLEWANAFSATSNSFAYPVRCVKTITQP